MADKRELDKLSVEELEQLIYLKKRTQRRQRLRRLRAEGRLVEVAGLISPEENFSKAQDGSGIRLPAGQEEEDLFHDFDDQLQDEEGARPRRIQWRWIANKSLLLVEIAALLGLVALAVIVWATARELNQEIAEVQKVQSASVALPTPTATPVIGVAVLPSGHKPPISGRPPEPGEAGYIPEHLLPIIDAYVPPPIPTPGPEQARRIQIPAIDIDKPIVQGDDWEQLKKGVGQHIGSAMPGRPGNLVLSAHNDIYGEIFRHLDRLAPGDEIIISSERRTYVYVVRDIDVVAPTDVQVMAPTEHASTTLISCYPYLVNNKRIVVYADLATERSVAGLSS